MTPNPRAAAPSVGFWFVVSSWAAAAAFLAWAAAEPRLDRMKRELDQLAGTESATASDWLVTSLRSEFEHHPDLTTELTGETGARAIEARQDGFTRSSHFHVAIGPRVTELLFETTTPARIELGTGSDRIPLELVPGRRQHFALPAHWRGRARLVEGNRFGGSGEVCIRGIQEPRSP